MGSKPALITTLPWRDILTRLWLLDPVQAWLPTNKKLKELTITEAMVHQRDLTLPLLEKAG